MVSLNKGDILLHNKHGEITFQRIVEQITEAEFSEVDDEILFEGGTVDKTFVRYYVPTVGNHATEPVEDFIENVNWEKQTEY